MTIIPKTDEAISFLCRWCKEGPWVLTAISPVQEGIITRTFLKEQLPEMQAWIEEHNGKRNLYFTINRTNKNFTSKPKRTDITAITALHLDVDPRVGEDIPSERIRILNSLKTFKPHPSIITDSGTGFQCFWLLETPILLDGTEATAIDAESYCVQLELLLGGDRCSNCDRVMRIPGTINIPNEVKKKKGRIPALASVIEWNDNYYALSDFIKAPTKIQRLEELEFEQLPGGGERVKISGNIQPLYVDDLPSKNINISDPIKVLIIHGQDPDNPLKYKSRSESLWAVVCALVRAEADDETIAAIILNRDNKISESVLDKSRPERYAAKQIQDAREEADDPILRKLNAKHAVIQDLGGRCRIISETFDYALKRPRISFASFEDFKNRYLNLKVAVAVDGEGRNVYKPAGQWWVMHPKRRQYETIVFVPGKEVSEAYNLWNGFACEALPTGDCGLFLEHIRTNLCQNNEQYYQYLISWMARCVQQPDCPGEVAIVLRGEQGTGKSIFAKIFGSLFGRHFLQVSDPKHLVGSFNSHLRDCVVIFGDEAFYAGDKKHESVLKALVTESHLTIESKGIDVVSAPNYTHVILASNSNWVVPAGSNERRFFALDVSAEKMQDKKYFQAMQNEINNGGREALLHFLLAYDISNFEVRDVPKTAALQDQKLLSMNSDELWWFEKLMEGRLLREQDYWEREIQKNELQNDYINFMQRVGIMRKSSPTILGKFLGRVCPGGMPRSYQKMAQVKEQGQYGEEYRVTRRVYFYELPELEKCRNHWDMHYGGPFKWHPPLERNEQIEFIPENVFE